MPLIELDMMIAFVNASDRLHRVSVETFKRIGDGRLRDIAIPTSAYMEYELVLRSRGYGDETIRNDVEAFKRIPNLREVPLSSSVLLEASRFRMKYALTYFDSLHAASALMRDGTIISVDEAYRMVKGLRVLDPRSLMGEAPR